MGHKKAGQILGSRNSVIVLQLMQSCYLTVIVYCYSHAFVYSLMIRQISI